MSDRNEAFEGDEGDHDTPCRHALLCATHLVPTQGDEVESFVAAIAYLFDGSEPATAVTPVSAAETTLPVKRVLPLTLPKLRPRPVRTLPLPSVLPPRTYPKVVLPPVAEAISPVGDTMMLGTTMFPPRPRLAHVLAGGTLAVVTALVGLVLFSDQATSRADSTPDPQDALAALVAARPPAPRPAGDVPAVPAPPAPCVAVASAPLAPLRALPAGSRRAGPLVARDPGGACLTPPPLRAPEKKSSRRLFSTED